jgi:hypothetical protein
MGLLCVENCVFMFTEDIKGNLLHDLLLSRSKNFFSDREFSLKRGRLDRFVHSCLISLILRMMGKENEDREGMFVSQGVTIRFSLGKMGSLRRLACKGGL